MIASRRPAALSSSTAAMPRSAACGIAWTVVFCVDINRAHASSGQRSCSRRLPGAGTRSPNPTSRGDLSVVDTEPGVRGVSLTDAPAVIDSCSVNNKHREHPSGHALQPMAGQRQSQLLRHPHRLVDHATASVPKVQKSPILSMRVATTPPPGSPSRSR